MKNGKLAIIGLDGLDPVVLSALLPDLPVFSSLLDKYHLQTLKSCDPPITVPAWTVMSTGLTPGELGIYGFTNKIPGRYQTFTANNNHVKALRIWEKLSAFGLTSTIIGMPQTAPAKPLNGYLVAGQLVGADGPLSVYPPWMTEQIDNLAGGHYWPDVAAHRTGSESEILKEALENCHSSFTLATDFAKNRYWDLLWLVVMGSDRIHHAALPQQLTYNSLRTSAVGEYYSFLDRQLGQFLQSLPPDSHWIILSDHGTIPCLGTFWLNRWLIEQKYLVTKNPIKDETDFNPDLIDWSKTRAYGQGGYYGRIYLNLAGREEYGIVRDEEASALKAEIKSKLEKMPTPWTNKPNQVLIPQDIYPACQGATPDLMLYAADLSARVIGLLGNNGTIWNDMPQKRGQYDCANHGKNGLLITNGGEFFSGFSSIYDLEQAFEEYFELNIK